MFKKSLQLIKNSVGIAFPCAAVAIGKGYNVFARQFFGNRQVEPCTLPLTEDTLFDLASLTKLTSTTMVALKLIENGNLRLDDNIGIFLDDAGNFEDCTIGHLLTHTSGMTPGLPLFNTLQNPDQALSAILNSERCNRTGDEVSYSCMGYIVLQKILEKIGCDSLDNLTQKYVFSPLGMNNACYNPEKNKPTLPVAATELYPHTREWATGHVHDENAYFLGGVSGNAGVFATLDDMIAFAGMCSERGVTENGDIYLSKTVFDMAIKNYTPYKAESRGLGFQLKGIQKSPMGELMSTGSYGHTGFTGTGFYTDYDTGLWGILLTNAVHYGRDKKEKYFSVRKSFYDTIITEYRSRNDKI